jgi:hypothetical protein
MADEKPWNQLRFETNLTVPQLLELLPQLAAKTGLKIEHISNPTIHIHIGEAAMDIKKNSETSSNITVGDITGATVGSIGKARDISVFTNHVDASSLSDDLKSELKEARRRLGEVSIPQEDKDDVAESLAKLAVELEKPEQQREESRLRRYFLRVREIAPVVASALSITASTLKMTGH